MSDELRQLTKLLWPFSSNQIHKNPSGYGDYVKHSTVEQRLLDVLGPVDFEHMQIVRGEITVKDKVIPDAVVGVVCRMVVTVDGRRVVSEEVGDCESPGNWPHDGARLKDAFSDAYKRCAMRIGVGLHLWAADDFYLAEKLLKQDRESAPESPQTDENTVPEPSKPPEVAKEPQPPISPSAASVASETIDWIAEGKSLGLSQSAVLAVARDVCADMGLDLPPSLKQVPKGPKVAEELFARLCKTAEPTGKPVGNG